MNDKTLKEITENLYRDFDCGETDISHLFIQYIQRFGYSIETENLQRITDVLISEERYRLYMREN
mgnify:CR=1 FL=1